MDTVFHTVVLNTRAAFVSFWPYQSWFKIKCFYNCILTFTQKVYVIQITKISFYNLLLSIPRTDRKYANVKRKYVHRSRLSTVSTATNKSFNISCLYRLSFINWVMTNQLRNISLHHRDIFVSLIYISTVQPYVTWMTKQVAPISGCCSRNESGLWPSVPCLVRQISLFCIWKSYLHIWVASIRWTPPACLTSI